MRMKSMLVAAAYAATVTVGSVAAHASQSWYADTQAKRGHDLFNNHCAECHRPDLTGAMGPALVGTHFWRHWGGKTVESLFNFEHTKMPATNPGSLPTDQVMAITAYILKHNGLPAGSVPLNQARAKRLVLAKSK